MGKARDACGPVYRALRARIGDGLYVPGAAVPILDLAEEFHASATPVREALARLCGEGLVQEARGRGYLHLDFDARRLEDLFGLERLYTDWALDALEGREVVPRGRPLAPEPPYDMREVLRVLVGACGNAALAAEHATLLLRLGAVWRAQARRAGAEVGRMAQELAVLMNRQDYPGLRIALHNFDDRQRLQFRGIILDMKRYGGP